MDSELRQTEPPWLGTRLLKWIYDDPIYSDVYGDLRELYANNYSRHGRTVCFRLVYARYVPIIKELRSKEKE